MNMPLRAACWPSLIVAVLWLADCAGCGYRRPALTQATGTVTLDGKPLAGASVNLVPERGGRPSVGSTDSKGRFTLSTYGSRDGAARGPHRIVVTKFVPRKPATESAGIDGAEIEAVNVLPPVYADPATTPFSVDVRPGMKPIDLPLESTPAQPPSKG